MESEFTINSYASTNIGLVRTTNEDFFAQLPDKKFFILADGMGGHNAGEVAAKEAVEFICKEIEQLHFGFLKAKKNQLLVKKLKELVLSVNKRIIKLSSQDPSLNGMGTTICSSYFFNNYIIYTHVGDSRLYRFRNNQLERLTIDHSLGNILKKDPTLKIPAHHKKSLTQAIGTHKSIAPDIGIEKVNENDIYFLCSDGLTDFVSDNEIQKVLIDHESIDEITEVLIEQAIHRGGRDNITIVMMKVHEHLSG